MSEKALRWIINIAGVVCLYLFLAVRILPLFNGILLEKYIPEYWENTQWGELYYFNFIKTFQEKNLPECHTKYRFSNRHPKLQDADILTFGDSFFDFSRMTTFPEQLGDSLNKRVYYARMDRPLKYLADSNYQPGPKRYLIFETAERFLHFRFEQAQDTVFYQDNRAGIRKLAANVRDVIFMEDQELKYSQLLARSYFSTQAYSAISTLKFNLFGQITNQTPAYKVDGEIPWLFGALQLGHEQGGFYWEAPHEKIVNYCDNIELLSKELRERYNLELVFMIIPSKYTIYHYVVGDDGKKYGNFIPKMYAELKKRNIPVIEVYDEFMAQRKEKLLFYGTDTHWTEDGLHIALNKTLNLLHTLPVDSYYTQAPVPEVKNGVLTN